MESRLYLQNIRILGIPLKKFIAMADFYDELTDFSELRVAPERDNPIYNQYHLWAVKEAGRVMASFHTTKMLGFLCAVFFGLRYIALTNLKDNPLMELSTWLSPDQLPYAMMAVLSHMTWRVGLNCECVVIGYDSYAPSYIRSAIIYINLFLLLLVALLTRTVYLLAIDASPNLAIVLSIVTALIGLHTLRFRNGSKINDWFNSAPGRHLFPISRRKEMPLGKAAFLSLYLIGTIAAAIYMAFRSFTLPK